MLQQSVGNSSIQWGLKGEWEGGREEQREWTGKQEMESRGEMILWEGSQSNYRQWCSPGFFGSTKFTFQWSLSLPEVFYFYLSFCLLFFPLIFTHGSHSVTSFSPFVWCRGKEIAYHQLSPYHSVMVRYEESQKHHSLHVSRSCSGPYQPSAEE